MTNATLTNTLVDQLAGSHKQINRSLIVFLILGLAGNIVAYNIFRQKRMRSNSMALLFTAAAVGNILVLTYGIGTDLYAVDHLHLETNAVTFCKLRLYIRHVLLMIVRSYVILACIIAFLISSPRTSLRSFSNSMYVKRMILAVPCLWPVFAVHMPVFTNIRRNQCINVDAYVLPFAVYFFFVVGILPVALMAVFISLTVRNLRELHRRTQPFIVTPKRLKSRDRQFIRMLLALVLMYVVSNLFYPVNVFYLAVTHSVEKSAERKALESLIFAVTSNHILYINNVSPCFLFFTVSAAFRQSCYRNIYQCLWSSADGRDRNVQQTPITNPPTKETRL